MNHHFWLQYRNVLIFDFSKNVFDRKFPRWLKVLETIWWLEAIFSPFLEDHWTIETSQRFMHLRSFGGDMELLVDYLLSDPSFSKKVIISNFDPQLWSKWGLTQTSFCTKFQNFWIYPFQDMNFSKFSHFSIDIVQKLKNSYLRKTIPKNSKILHRS